MQVIQDFWPVLFIALLYGGVEILRIREQGKRRLGILARMVRYEVLEQGGPLRTGQIVVAIGRQLMEWGYSPCTDEEVLKVLEDLERTEVVAREEEPFGGVLKWSPFIGPPRPQQ
jgi:hypothetical protein